MAGWFWLVGGVNGAGKTTLVAGLLGQPPELRHSHARLFGILTDPNIVWLNPDRIAAEWVHEGRYPDFAAANKAAADHVEAECDRLIASGASVMAETVLSSSKYVGRVAVAKRAGMRFGLIYVVLQTPEIAIARVATRVAAGGHDVPPEKVAARWRRSLDSLPHFFREADVAVVFDNSDPSGAPRLLVSKVEDVVDVSGLRWNLVDGWHPLYADLMKAIPPRDNVVGLPRDPED
jgi:predicted ABC-type ATPase